MWLSGGNLLAFDEWNNKNKKECWCGNLEPLTGILKKGIMWIFDTMVIFFEYSRGRPMQQVVLHHFSSLQVMIFEDHRREVKNQASFKKRWPENYFNRLSKLHGLAWCGINDDNELTQKMTINSRPSKMEPVTYSLKQLQSNHKNQAETLSTTLAK